MPSKTNPLLTSAADRVSKAMDKLKFNGTMSVADVDQIRIDVQQARSEVTMYSDINGDSTGTVALINKSIDLVENALARIDHQPNLL